MLVLVEGDYSDGDDHQGHVEKIEEMLLWSFGDRLQGKVGEIMAWCLKNLFDVCSLSDFWNAIVRLGRREGRTSWTGLWSASGGQNISMIKNKDNDKIRFGHFSRTNTGSRTWSQYSTFDQRRIWTKRSWLLFWRGTNYTFSPRLAHWGLVNLLVFHPDVTKVAQLEITTSLSREKSVMM